MSEAQKRHSSPNLDESGQHKRHKRHRSPGAGQSENPDIEELKSELFKVIEDLEVVRNQVNKIDKRVQRNEAHSRQRNIRFYLRAQDAKTKVQGMEKKERGALYDIFHKGLKIEESRAKQIIGSVDLIHWTPDGALIVAFCKRGDVGQLKAGRKHLKDYKLFGKPISMEDDLTKEDQEIKKKCVGKFKEMKTDKEKNKNPKIYSFNKIVANDTVKYYYEW